MKLRLLGFLGLSLIAMAYPFSAAATEACARATASGGRTPDAETGEEVSAGEANRSDNPDRGRQPDSGGGGGFTESGSDGGSYVVF